MAIDISNRPNRPIRKITVSTNKKPKFGVSSDFLKVIAVIAMTIDHIAWIYVPFGSTLGQIMHIIGRITAPVMCFFISEGYLKTRNLSHYALRLGLFAIISHIPFVYFETGKIQFLYRTSIMLPLFIGLLALAVRDSLKIKPAAKSVIILVMCIAASIGDWGSIAVVWILIFGSRISRGMQIKYFCIANAVYIILDIIINASMGAWYNDLFQLGVFLAVPFILMYNGERHGKTAARWFYYIYYPVHMVFIRAIYPAILSLSVYIVHHYASGR